MKRIDEAQIPARGIMETGDYGNSKYYRISCRCGNPDDDLQLNVESEDNSVTVHIWNTTKTAWWRRRFDDRDNFIVHWCLQRLNDYLNRIDVAWTALTKGYVETESWTLLNKQEAYNLANTLNRAIDDVEEFEKQRAIKKNQSA